MAMQPTGEKIPCIKCGRLILPQTAVKYDGRCAPCGKPEQQPEQPPVGCVIAGGMLLFGLYTGILLLLDGPSSWLLEPVPLLVALVVALIVPLLAWAGLLPAKYDPPKRVPEKMIEESAEAEATPHVAYDADAPLPLYSKDPAEAVRLLFDRAVPNLPKMTEEQIENAYQDCKWAWAAQKLHRGEQSEIADLLEHNAERIRRLEGFRDFKVFIIEGPNPCAALYGIVDQTSGPSISEPIGLWVVGSTYFACGNSDFNDAHTDDISVPTSDTAIFVFDYDQLEDSFSYGRDIAQAIQQALMSTRGRCAFADGDLEVAAGGVTNVAGFLERLRRAGWHVVPADENSPLNRLSELSDESMARMYPIYGFASAMWTDTPRCARIIHRNLSTSFSGPYLGVLIRERSAGSHAAFFDVIRPFSLVPATAYCDGQIISDANLYGI